MDAESSTKEDVKEVVEHLDTDYSGHINFEEFSQIIKDILSVMVEENMFLNAISAFLINTNSLRCINISNKEINGFSKKWKKNIPLGCISEGDDIFKLLYKYKRLFNMNSKIEPDENIMLQGCDIYYNNFSTSNKKVFYNVKNDYYTIDNNNNNFLS